ncbi:MAG: SPOR domain-containing protein [Alphaproteobacteria bacterium]|nr:SPOR domain-containing protein [Alphaproteobacteria bacterium]
MAFEDDDRDYVRIPRDLLDADDPQDVLERHRVRRAPVGILLGIVAGLAVAGGIAWYVYDKIPKVESKGSEIPVIKAANEPFKVKPDDPGGMEVPNRDRLIYQQMGEAAPPAEEEHLLPPPETPEAPPPPEPAMVVPQPPARVDAPVVKAPETVPPEVSAPTVVVAPPQAKEPMLALPHQEIKTPPAPKEVPTPKEASAPAPKDVAKPVPVVKDAKAPPATVKAAALPPTTPAKPVAASPPVPAKPVAAAGGGVRVQLVALRSTEAAEGAWSQLAAKHKDVLGGLSHWVAKVDLGDKGTWYRVQAGSFPSAESATAACETLKQRGVGCILVKK